MRPGGRYGRRQLAERRAAPPLDVRAGDVPTYHQGGDVRQRSPLDADVEVRVGEQGAQRRDDFLGARQFTLHAGEMLGNGRVPGGTVDGSDHGADRVDGHVRARSRRISWASPVWAASYRRYRDCGSTAAGTRRSTSW